MVMGLDTKRNRTGRGRLRKSTRHWTAVHQDSEKSGGNGRMRDQEPSPNIPLRAIRDTIVISSATHPADVSAAAAHGLEKRRRQSRSLDATKLKRYTGVARVTP